MKYTVQKLARLAGVSTRTLRYYDAVGLLRPMSVGENGYRLYGQAQVDALQQILFYRAQGIQLRKIKEIMAAPDYDRVRALEEHLLSLQRQKEQVDRMIGTIRQTIRSMKGEIRMSDQEKFEGFKKRLAEENEVKYGKEIRTRYGDDAVDASAVKLREMDEETWKQAEELRRKIDELLQAAMRENDPCGKTAQQACALHEQWIKLFWKDGAYSKAAHRGLGRMYETDDRFRAYYEGAIGPGAAQFLCRALEEYTK
jgi:Predicted transcriptional regulators